MTLSAISFALTRIELLSPAANASLGPGGGEAGGSSAILIFQDSLDEGRMSGLG
jgi:hypothetical protein